MTVILPGALWRLLLWSVQGRVRRLARQLRKPRYLITFLAGSAYFVWLWFFVIFRSGGPVRIQRDAPDLSGVVGAEDAAFAVHLFLALGAAVAVTLIWILLRARPRLTLSAAEIQALLPAPLPRRQILAFALVRTQPAVLFSALVISIIRGNFLHLPALWAVITLADWHFKGVTLWKVRCRDAPPQQAWWMRGAVVALFLAFWIAVGAQMGDLGREIHGIIDLLRQAGPDAEVGQRLVALPSVLVDSFAEGTGALTPFLWLTAPFLPQSFVGPAAAAVGWGLLFALLALHFLWIVSTPVRFEDAVLESARRMERKRSGRPERAKGKSRQRHPFSLAPQGRPEVAILWKNLLLLGRVPLRTLAMISGGIYVVAYFSALQFGERFNLVTIATFLAGILMVFFPGMTGMMFRMDLRHDLEKVDLVRCWPVTGWRLVLAEVAAPVLTTTFLALQAGLILLSVALGTASLADPHGEVWITPARALLVVGAGLPVALGLASLSATVMNGVTLLFPSWVPLGLKPRTSGPANTGTAAILFLGHGFGMFVGLALAGGTAGIVALLLVWVGVAPGVVILTTAWLGALVLLATAFTLVVLAGRRWDSLDPSQELLGEDS